MPLIWHDRSGGIIIVRYISNEYEADMIGLVGVSSVWVCVYTGPERLQISHSLRSSLQAVKRYKAWDPVVGITIFVSQKLRHIV